jgi:hypothetical protein
LYLNAIPVVIKNLNISNNEGLKYLEIEFFITLARGK